MISIIETHLSIDDEGKIADFQSRVIEHKSWEDFVNEIKNGECKFHPGTMQGCSLPREAKVMDLKYDDIHLSCEVSNGVANFRKYAYLIKETDTNINDIIEQMIGDKEMPQCINISEDEFQSGLMKLYENKFPIKR